MSSAGVRESIAIPWARGGWCEAQCKANDGRRLAWPCVAAGKLTIRRETGCLWIDYLQFKNLGAGTLHLFLIQDVTFAVICGISLIVFAVLWLLSGLQPSNRPPVACFERDSPPADRETPAMR